MAWALIISCTMIAVHQIQPEEPISISKCLVQTNDLDALRGCFGPVVSSADYDLYAHRYNEILYKTEAY